MVPLLVGVCTDLLRDDCNIGPGFVEVVLDRACIGHLKPEMFANGCRPSEVANLFANKGENLNRGPKKWSQKSKYKKQETRIEGA